MRYLLQKAKETIKSVFKRAKIILQEIMIEDAQQNNRPVPNNLEPIPFQIQFAVYRDYDCGRDKILETSGPWETQPERLWQFLDRVKAKG